MQEGFKKDNLLTDNLRDNLSGQRLDRELDLKIEALAEKLLENKNSRPHLPEKDTCIFRNTCYVAKSQMGSCPCELYK